MKDQGIHAHSMGLFAFVFRHHEASVVRNRNNCGNRGKRFK
jgi:hypothetical protein